MRLNQIAGPAPMGRLAMHFGALFAVAMAIVGVVVFVVAEQAIINRIDDVLAYHSSKFVAGIDPARRPTIAVTERIADWQHRKTFSERTYLLFDANGARVAGRLALPPLATGYSDVSFKAGGHSWQHGRALARRLPDGGLFVVIQHSEAAAQLRAMLIPLIGGILACAILAGLAAAFLVARLTARRLAATLAAAEAIAGGDLSRRVATDQLDGMFAVQAHSLNAMLDRMELMMESQRHFASSLAHDLRTPLTRLRGVLAMARGNRAGEPDQLIERAERECAAIITIFDSLLRLAEIETGRHSSAMQEQDLGELVQDALETMEPVIADAGSLLTTGGIEQATIRCDAALITQLLINLLENIVTHTPPSTRATVALHRRDDRAVLVVADNGPGLAQTDRDRVIRPFERGANTRATGSGLGLAIARAIVEFHGGELTLGDNGPGLIVAMSFPVATAGQSSVECRAAA